MVPVAERTPSLTREARILAATAVLATAAIAGYGFSVYEPEISGFIRVERVPVMLVER